jgi:uncharacterized membrane protein/mono/diheme cytochrome c family protein
MNQRSQHIIFNICIGLNCLLFFLLLFGADMRVPALLQVTGRMHPLTVHFPIVLLIVAFVWELVLSKNENYIVKEAGDWLLLSAAFTAVLGALMGLFLSKEEGYDQSGIALHKWMGSITAMLTICWFGFRNKMRESKAAIFSAGIISLAIIIIAGHQGANITHGENFLLAPVTPEKKKPDVLFEDAVAYTHLVRPILEEKCMTCHNSNKAKGQLVMETEELLLKGGKNGKLWDSTEAGFGLMMKRIHLPDEEKEHMPPKGKPQLTDEEIKALYHWIKSGADFTKKITAYPETDTIRIVAAGFFKTLETDNYDFAAADDGLIKKLNTDYRVVHALALNSPALSVDFFGASSFKNEQLDELEKIKNNIVTLNLGKMPVTDKDLEQVAAFKNLRKLNLSFTSVTGATLNELKKLTDLRQLSLSGTKVKAADLESLKGLEKLSSIYLWNTAISENELANLKTKFPKVNIEKGFTGDTIMVRLNAPIIKGEERIFTGSIGVLLKHYVNGVVMRYTLDGSEPDSLLSPVYKDSIVIAKPGMLKVKAFLPGWISSDAATANYFKTGFIADSVRLVLPPDPSYPGSGGKTLSDKIKGELNFRDGKWLGYKDNDMQAFFYFNNPILLSNVSISTIVDIGSYIMPAYQLEVWGGASVSNLTLLKKINPKQPATQVPGYLIGFDCSFETKKLSVLKLVAKPVSKLPAWHQGSGQKGWVFIDEVFLN